MTAAPPPSTAWSERTRRRDGGAGADEEWHHFPKDGRYIVPAKPQLRQAEHLDEGP